MADTTQLTFRALADPTRREILKLLSQQEMTIADVSARFDMTRAAVKKHLTVLSDGGMITVTSRGRERINRINPAGFTAALSWFEYFDSFWDDRLDALKTAIEKDRT
ncbi:MAG: winged helix-turn-helix transcriptional regulator [Sulfitobacter sp.]|nr:winged helix-turn-helix transcriptional regulator [Sulfitobacter sp.]